MAKLIPLILNCLSFYLVDFLLDDLDIPSLLSLVWISLCFSFLNTFVMPLLKLLTFPLRLLTLGLFTFVLNGALLYLLSFLFPQHLHLESFGTAVKASFLLAFVSFVLTHIFK